MSDYSRVHDFSVKDALPSGDANKKVKGSEVDAEFDAIVTSNGTKANKVVSGTDGAYAVQDSNGDMADGGVVISSFVDTLLDDADAETARITLGAQSAANGSTIVESGTTGQRDGSPAAGYLRHNTTTSVLEWYNGSSWEDVNSGASLITTRGDILRGDSIGSPERYAAGTEGQVLRPDSSGDIVWADNTVSGTAQATTSGTAKTFTGLPPWVTWFAVIFSAVSIDAVQHVEVQIGPSGGLVTTGYTSLSEFDGLTAATDAFTLYANSATQKLTGVAMCFKIDGTEWIMSHGLIREGNKGIHGAGRVDISGTLERVGILLSGSGDFDGGKVNIVYG